ncbi:hypothetical protein LWC08_10565 [Desulfobaculum bizertense]|uniref:hypothetical protein n=1 Tax=Desulfobaculum bizertense TaxID=376490 RepID=UPI001F282CED|nr:hypothetical protein [Desulfobaculum bizertense]UIJ37173.1 hypothetical protein LWC08_10565 [Desulfobaculum bizertense]
MRKTASMNKSRWLGMVVALAAGVFFVTSTLAMAKDMTFSRELKMQGVTFKVTCPNAPSGENKVKVVPSGLKADNRAVEQEIYGYVTNAEVGDLNADGSPELYIYVTAPGSGAFGTVVGYGVNNKKSMSEIGFPDIMADKKLSDGYGGHDEFAVVENSLARRFPIYKAGDSNAGPSGGTRQIQYKLAPGNNGWKLVIDKVVEY